MRKHFHRILLLLLGIGGLLWAGCSPQVPLAPQTELPPTLDGRAEPIGPANPAENITLTVLYTSDEHG